MTSFQNGFTNLHGHSTVVRPLINGVRTLMLAVAPELLGYEPLQSHHFRVGNVWKNSAANTHV